MFDKKVLTPELGEEHVTMLIRKQLRKKKHCLGDILVYN